MDRYSSSSHSRHHYSSSSSSNRKYEDRDDRRRKRSRSRSPRYPSSYSRHEKTRREFEIEVEALQEENKELRGQIEQYRAQITNVSLAQVQAEQRAAHWEHETNRINVSYQECTKVLMALRQGVDELERQKQHFIDEASKAQKERDIADLTSSNYRQQIELAQERNIALVKKCETYVGENKALKEKVETFETELKELRPACGRLETELDKAQKDNKVYHEENAVLREKEKSWITEKREFEKKLLIKEALAAAERKNNHRNENFKVDGIVKGVENERIKRLEMVIDSLHTHYESRLQTLEAMLTEDDSTDHLIESEMKEETPESRLLSQQLTNATAAVVATIEHKNEEMQSLPEEESIVANSTNN
jgi:chromosome segregation ATPase